MPGRRRSELVEAHADLILSGELSAGAYMVHFEVQMRRSRLRRLLHAGYVYFARAGAVQVGVDPRGIW
jgi:hypothetical protein